MEDWMFDRERGSWYLPGHSRMAPWSTLISMTTEAPNRFLHNLGRGPATVLLAVSCIAALAGLSGTGMSPAARAAPAVPADLLMQSVVTRDGDLGWKQLCPDLQKQVPPGLLHDVALTQRTSESGQNLRLTVDLVGVRTQPKGGEYRFYVVTARQSDGGVLQRPYTLVTQPNGCVEEVG